MTTSIPGASAPAPATDAGSALAALRCRDDILQALFWLRGEGFAADADVDGVARLIGLDRTLVGPHLGGLVRDGYLEERAGRYRLSELGAREGGRRFADEFADLQLTAHGECPPDCPHCEAIERDGCTHCVTGRLED